MTRFDGSQISRRRFLRLSALAGAAVVGSALTACAGAGSSTAARSDGVPASSSADPSEPEAVSASGSYEADSSTWLASDPQERTLFLFDTVVALSCYCSEELMDQAADRCAYFEERFSRTKEGSDVWNVNNASGQRVTVASETADLVRKALGYCEQSGGLFDITIGAVSRLWDFVDGVKPSDEAIAEAVRHVDYRGVNVQDDDVWLDDPQAAIDLGGIAKGYIADDLARLFREGGCESGMINLGGNVYVIGSKPDGSQWMVGVQDPNSPVQEVVAKVPCTDKSVVTSGLYERQFEQDGTTYYHILDPKTGYPVETDLVSSSVVCDSSLDGDAYATWMFLLGHDAALSLLNETPGLEGLVVDEGGAISLTDAAEFELVTEP